MRVRLAGRSTSLRGRRGRGTRFIKERGLFGWSDEVGDVVGCGRKAGDASVFEAGRKGKSGSGHGDEGFSQIKPL